MTQRFCASAQCSAAVLAAAAVAACAPETLEVNYDTYAIAVKAGALEAGWLPQWLPKNATRIFERHNIDTNARMWVADVPVGSEVSLPQGCSAAVAASLPAPPFQRPWWPDGIPHHQSAESGFIYFQCGSEFAGVAAAGGKLIGWSLQ